MRRAVLALLLPVLLAGGCRCRSLYIGPRPAQCRTPYAGTDCHRLEQTSESIEERRVCGAPPAAIGGWYPAGTYALTASTLYTTRCQDTNGPPIRYGATLEVASDKQTPSIDHYRLVQSQAGCDEVTAEFAGDTFGHPGDEPFDHVSSVAWTCPSCPTCPTKVKYSGSKTLFTLFLPLEDGSTLVQEFSLRTPAPGAPTSPPQPAPHAPP